MKVYTPYLGILAWLYSIEHCFKSRFIHYIQVSGHGCMLKNTILNQGLYTISRDLSWQYAKESCFKAKLIHHIQGYCHGCILKNPDFKHVYTPYLMILSWLNSKESSFKSGLIYHISGSYHGRMLKNTVLNQYLYTTSRDFVMVVCSRLLFYIKVDTPYLGILSCFYSKEPCFKSRFIHYIQGSCHCSMLKNYVLNQGLYTISRDVVMTIC